MKMIFNIVYYTLAVCALLLFVLLLLLQTDMLPGYEVRIVQSGSMEPAISTGSVVVIQSREQYEVGDIITFGEDRTNSLPTTHRIIETTVQEGSLAFITQGDANEDRDMRPVLVSEVRGKVLFSVPYIGFLLDFARQPIGFALLIGIPAFIVAVEEVSNIVAAVRGRKKDEVGEEEKPEEDSTSDTTTTSHDTTDNTDVDTNKDDSEK